MADRFLPIPSGTSPEQMLAMINRNFAELDRQATNQLYKDENGTPSISIGVLPGGTTQIKVAKPGKDVTTAPDADLIFNSSQNVFKVVASGTQVVTKAASDDFEAVVVPHGLGYVPVAIVYIEQFNGISYDYQPTPFLTLSAGTPITISMVASVNVNDEFITFFVNSTNSGGPFTNPATFTFKYYLMQESAN